MSPASHMPHAARTDVGQRRDHNEDALHASPPVFVVADGVGGSAKGEVASQLSIDTFAQQAAAIVTAASAQDATSAMEHAVLAANTAVHEAQLRDASLRGMATTFVAAVVRDGGEVIVGHVGDSRLYVLSAAGARAATSDHSVVAELVRSGRLDAEDAATHPQRNVITRALGPEPDVSVDAFVLHVGPGDWLLACSDGLTEHVGAEELAPIMLEHAARPDEAVRALVDLANARGGSDNISVVVAQPVPSDVSGELSLEALQFAASAVGTTTQLPAAGGSEAPAHRSGPLPLIVPEGSSAAETSGELPTLEPLDEDSAGGWHDEPPRSHRVRGWLLFGGIIALAAIIGGFTWSQSYFLVEREDGRVGINRGFPIGRLSVPHRSSDIVADELDPADRERLIVSHRILSREDAERVLDDLPQQIDPTIEEARGDLAARA